MAGRKPDPQSQSSDENDGQWTKVEYEDADNRMPQFNGTNLSSGQLATTTADDGGSGTPLARTIVQMGHMDIGDVSSNFDLEDGYDTTHYAGSNNSGATDNSAGVETDRCRFAPTVQGARAPGPHRLTEETLGIHTRQQGQRYLYADIPGGWVPGLAFLSSERDSKPSHLHPKGSESPQHRKPPASTVISDTSSAWAPVYQNSGLAHDIAGAGDWATDIPAPPRSRGGGH